MHNFTRYFCFTSFYVATNNQLLLVHQGGYNIRYYILQMTILLHCFNTISPIYQCDSLINHEISAIKYVLIPNTLPGINGVVVICVKPTVLILDKTLFREAYPWNTPVHVIYHTNLQRVAARVNHKTVFYMCQGGDQVIFMAQKFISMEGSSNNI